MLRCLDGEAGTYEVAAADSRSPEAVLRRDAELIHDAARVLRPGERYRPDIVALLLLASGAYHRDVPATPLLTLASRPPFVCTYHDVCLRADLTPAMWRLFGGRLEGGGWAAGNTKAYRLPTPVIEGCRYRLRTQFGQGWWAEMEASAEHSLADLHQVLLRAVGFDGDHLCTRSI